LDWMDTTTQNMALQKIDAISNLVGYPDVWENYYAELYLPPGKYFENYYAIEQFHAKHDLDYLYKPVDRSLWLTSPATVEAYYLQELNAITFSAAILQPPFYNISFPAPVNFGAIGSIMGREMMKGFDDSGRRFDATGRLFNWWSPVSSQNFRENAQCVVDMYDGYTVDPTEGLTVNGLLTLGENMADMGGVKYAWGAYQDYLTALGEADAHTLRSMLERAFKGLTADQLFFISYAQTYCTLTTPEFERLQVDIGPESPARFRVLGPLSNLPSFASTFSCAAGSNMSPVDQCSVW